MHESGGESAPKKGSAQRAAKEWPAKLTKTLCLLLTLGAGVLVGIAASLHLMGYFRAGILSSFMPSSMNSPQQHIHVHVMANQDVRPFYHGMGDEELLWRASMAPQRPGLPIARTPKVACMFLTVGPMPLGPVWERFFKGHEQYYNIYVHALPDFEPQPQPSSVFFGRYIPSRVSLVASKPFLFVLAFLHNEQRELTTMPVTDALVELEKSPIIFDESMEIYGFSLQFD